MTDEAATAVPVRRGAPSIATVLGGGAEALRAIRLAGVVIATLFNAAAAAAQSLATIRAMNGARADA
jgi:hypothetical protein